MDRKGNDGAMPALLQAAWSGLAGVDVAMATHASRAQIERLQQQRLDNLLAWACRRSPLYRQRRAGRLADMEPVRKPELMRRHAEWITDPQLDWAALQGFLADPAGIGSLFGDRYMVWTSSGSSGTPGVFLQDRQAMAVYDALEAVRRPMLAGAADWLAWPAERFAFVGATGGHFASIVQVERVRRLLPQFAGSLHSLSFVQPRADLCRRLAQLQPAVIATYPSMALVLADEAQAGRLRLHLRQLLCGGETLTPAVRRLLGERFACRVINSYGASEFIALAFECAHGRLHLNADWAILEPVDECGRPVPDDVFSHSTLLTNLANFTQPLIRYDLGDRVCIRSAPCSCGVALPVVEVEGRSDALIELTNASGGRVRLSPLALSTLIEDEAGVHDYVLDQLDAQALDLSVARHAPAGALPRARCALRRFLDQQGLAPVRLRAHLVDELPRSAAGKQQRIVPRRPA